MTAEGARKEYNLCFLLPPQPGRWTRYCHYTSHLLNTSQDFNSQNAGYIKNIAGKVFRPAYSQKLPTSDIIELSDRHVD